VHLSTKQLVLVCLIAGWATSTAYGRSEYATPPTEQEFAEAWNSGTRYRTGPAYNKIGEEPSAATQAIIEYFKDLGYASMTNQLDGKTHARPKAPRKDGWGRIADYENPIVSGRINFTLFEADAPNAFAAELTNAGTVQSRSAAKLAPYGAFKSLFGEAAELYQPNSILACSNKDPLLAQYLNRSPETPIIFLIPRSFDIPNEAKKISVFFACSS
jgi:hypothetical protein